MNNRKAWARLPTAVPSGFTQVRASRMDGKLKSVIRMAVTAGALVSAVGLAAPVATAGTAAEASPSGTVSATAAKWNCRYDGMICIRRSGGYLSSKWSNNVAYSNKGTLGVAFSKSPVYPLPRGSQLKALKTGKIEARSAWTSVLYKCPKKYKYARTYVHFTGAGTLYGNVIKCR